MENEEYFTSFYPVRANGWTLLLIQTVRELDREMHNTFILIIIVFIISIILAIAVTSRLLYRITKPLKDNLNILKDIAEGKGDFKGLQSISSHDEFEELSGHFQTIFTRMDEVAKDLNVNLRKEKLEKIQIVDELEDSQRRFKAIFNHTYQFMFLINTEGKIVEVNDSLLLFTGDKRYKLINTNFWQTIWWGPEEDTSRIEKTVLRALKGGFVREEFLISGKDGTHTMDFTIKPIRDKHDNSVVMLIAEGRDITDRKKMEKELEDHRNHLKELVEEKTTELKAAQLELIRKSKFATLGKLTAVVSHEIRNPLATIRSSSFVIKRKLKDKDEKIVKVLDRIDRNVHRCDTIIEDLLSYTRETMLEIRIIDLDQWIVSFEEIFSTYKNVTMVYQLQSGAKASLDTERFRRVIINLVENAKQAFDSTTFQSDRKPEITIKTESREECVLIHIMDNGPGIPEENMEKIFEPLFSTKSFGIGLGLPIVMQLIEKHNGILTVDSEEGKGTTFSISLPGRA
ncbi:MAG: PAS domain S-box protein [Spirochaetales bacterium]|nr:PAS domain S-box protein [Spirochaetales bacterium]